MKYDFYLPEFKYLARKFKDNEIENFYTIPFMAGSAAIDRWFKYMQDVQGYKLIENWLLSEFYLYKEEANV